MREPLVHRRPCSPPENQLLSDTFENKYVGVHSHSDRQNQARHPRKCQHGVERRKATHDQRQVHTQSHHSQNSGPAVVEDHDQDHSAHPDEAGDPAAELHGRDIAACRSIAWAGYLSTTGVYGDRAGGWVDEDSALAPTSERAERRVAAERAWLDLRRNAGLPLHVFRLAGIYGPGRSAFDQLRAGTAKRLYKPGQAFSRIHVDDLARTLEASIARPNPGRVYNLCDDAAAPPAEVIATACELLGVAPPPLVLVEAAGLSAMALSFYRDNKRVSNRRIKEELGVALAYPDYKAGLQAIFEAES